MSKKQAKKTRASASLKRMSRSKTLLAGAILAAPMIAGVPMAYSQPGGTPGADNIQRKHVANLKYSDMFFKVNDKFTIVGMDKGHTIYRKAGGEMFWIDPNTGDMKTVDKTIWIKWTWMKDSGGSMLKMVKFSPDWLKAHSDANNVRLVGLDASGHVIQQNSKGKLFFIDPMTGDITWTY